MSKLLNYIKNILNIFRNMFDRINKPDFQKMAETSQTLFILQSVSGHVLYISKNAKLIVGYSSEFLYKHGIPFDLIHCDDVENCKKVFQNLTQGISVIDFEYRFFTENNDLIWVRHNAIPLFENNHVVKIQSNIINITKQKKAQEDLKNIKINLEENESLLNKTGELAKIGAWEINLKSQSLKWTQEIYKIHEVSSDFIPNFEKAIAFCDDISKEIIQNAVSEAIKTQKSFDVKLSIITAQGNKKKVRLIGEVKKENNIPTVIYGAFQDITESELLQNRLIFEKEKAEEANKAKSQFLSNISHEIRTPLNGIIGLTDLLYESEENKEKKEFMKGIVYSGEILLELINNILDIAKIEAGKYELAKNKINLKTFADQLSLIFKSSLKENVIYEYFVDKDINFDVIGDEIRLKQIMINLFNNSKKFTEKGIITFEIKLDKSNKENDVKNIIFSLKDTGTGIKKENFRLIFEKFTQENMTIDKKYGGSGLGLAIVKELVNLMKGTIEIESEYNIGTEIKIKIPFEIVENSVNTVQSKSTLKNEIKKSKIILVEDNEINQNLVKAILISQKNIELDICDNGKDGLERILKGKYDLTLMDIQLPGMNGMEVIKEIKKNNINIKIIAVTAYALEDNKKSIIELGIDEYISKPFKKDELLTKINNVLNK